MPLRVQIFGPDGDISQKKPATFVTTLTDILDVAQRARESAQSDLDIAARMLIAKPSTNHIGGSETAQLQSATAVLRSTKYTVAMMSHSTLRNQSARLHQLPHTDQRNLVFVPCFEGQSCLGGMAIFSHYPLSHDVTAAALVILKKVVYNLKSAHLLTGEGWNGGKRRTREAMPKISSNV